MAYDNLPSLLQHILSQQGGRELSPDEEYLLRMQQQQNAAPPMEKIMMAQGPTPADVFARSPGSTANAIMNRRQTADQAGAGVLPQDVLAPAAAPQGNAPAQQSVRGPQSAGQHQQLIMLLMKRGMTREQAEAAAGGM